MKVQALSNYVLTLPDEKIKKLGSIHVAEQSMEEPYTATVVSVGPGRIDNNGNRIPMDIKEGDRVLHKSYGITTVDINGEEHFMLEDQNILMIILEEEEKKDA